MDNDPKHIAEATQELLKAQVWNVIKWPSQSGSSHLLGTKLKAKRFTNKQEQKVSEVKGKGNSLWKHMVTSMGSSLEGVINCTGFASDQVKKKKQLYIHIVSL